MNTKTSNVSSTSSSSGSSTHQAPHYSQDQAVVNNVVSSSTTSGDDLQANSSAAYHCNHPSHEEPIYVKCTEQSWKIGDLEAKIVILRNSEVVVRKKELQRKLDEAIDSRDDLQDLVNLMEAEIDQEKSAKDVLEKKMAVMEAEKMKADSLAATLQAELISSTKSFELERSTMKMDKEALEEKLARLEAEKIKANAFAATLQAELTFSAKLFELERSQLKSEKDSLEEQLAQAGIRSQEELRKANSACAMIVEEKNVAIAQRDAERTHMDIEKALFNEELQKKDDELLLLTKNYDDVVAQLAQIKNERELEQSTLLKTTEEKTALEQKVQELQQELEKKEIVIGELALSSRDLRLQLGSQQEAAVAIPERMIQEGQGQDVLFENRGEDPEPRSAADVKEEEGGDDVQIVEEMEDREDRGAQEGTSGEARQQRNPDVEDVQVNPPIHDLGDLHPNRPEVGEIVEQPINQEAGLAVLEDAEEPMDQRPGSLSPMIENAGGSWWQAVKMAKARGWYKRWPGQSSECLFNPFPESRKRGVPQVVRFVHVACKLSAQERKDLRDVQRAQEAAGLIVVTY